MANRFPLIIDANDNKIKEIPENDNLSLHNNNIIGVVNITSEGTITAESLYINSETVNINGKIFSDVAFTGKYIDLVERPLLFTGSYNDLTDKPALFTGSYNDLTDKPANLSQFNNDVGFLTLAESPTLSLIGTTLRISNGNSVDLSELGSGGNGSGIALTSLSVTSLAATGSGTLTYDDTTGVFYYTPPNLSAYLTDYTETDPVVGAVNGIVKADGAGNISAAIAGTDYLSSTSDVDAHLNQSNPTSGYVLSWNGTDYAWVAQTASGGGTMSNVVEDTTPQLGGALDLSSKDITGIGNINITGTIDATDLITSDTGFRTTGADGVYSTNDIETGSSYRFGGTSFNTTLSKTEPTAARTTTFPDASGTVALTRDIPVAYTDADVDAHLNQSNPTSGYVLSWNGTDYAWVAQTASGGSTASRNQYSGTTASINNQESGNLDVTGCKTYTLFKITTDKAAWVTLYADAASRTADTRTYADKGSDPSTSGVIAEVITTGGETVLIAPGVVGFNNESTPTTNIPMKVWNDSGSAGTVTVTVDVLTLEA